MPLWQQFCAGAYATRSPVIDAEACINLFPETLQAGENAKHVALYGTPGLLSLFSTADAGCRGLYRIDTRTFAVLGTRFGEVDTVLNTFTFRGNVATDGNPASMVGGQPNVNTGVNGQLLIVSGGLVYVFRLDTNVFSGPISLPLQNAPVQADYLSTYFLLTEANTHRVWYTTDATSWAALNYFVTTDINDNLVGLKVVGTRVYLQGSRTTEVYYLAGGVIPFVVWPGTVIYSGLASPWASVIAGNALVWLATDALGQGAVMTTASTANLATPAVRFAWSKYATLADAEAFTYDIENHVFVGFTFPGADATWVYDLVEGVWHQRDTFDAVTATSHRWRVRGMCAVGQKVFAGDATTGNIYQVDMETFTDNGGTLRRLRRAPYLSASNQWMFLDAVELGLQTGVGVTTGQGSAPTLQARISRDGGHTWDLTTTGIPSSGAIGVYSARTIWRRLGRVRADRFVFEVTQSDPVRTVWGPGLFLRLNGGSEQL